MKAFGRDFKTGERIEFDWKPISDYDWFYTMYCEQPEFTIKKEQLESILEIAKQFDNIRVEVTELKNNKVYISLCDKEEEN